MLATPSLRRPLAPLILFPLGIEISARGQDVAGSSRIDANGREYYEMMPPSVRGGATHNERLFVDWGESGGFVHYNATTFPSFCKSSASFTFWIRSEGSIHPGYVIRRYDSKGTAWSLFVTNNGVDAYGRFFPNDLLIQFPENIGSIFKQSPKSAGMRHIAAVFDVECNCLRVHLDGEFVGQSGLPKDKQDFADIDCEPQLPDDYISLFHRQPGAWPFKGDVQDFRYYRVALSAEEIHDLAFPPQVAFGNIIPSLALTKASSEYRCIQQDRGADVTC